MKKLRLILAGILLSFGLSWLGLAMIPYFQLTAMEPVLSDEGYDLPPPLSGQAELGRQVYMASGCVYCHTQQIRPFDVLPDHDRDWGRRRSVPRDYSLESPALTGKLRLGQDLSNIGRRQENTDWQYKHLYAPGLMSPGSTMPPYRYLFVLKPLSGDTAADALLPGGKFTADIPAGYQLVPTAEAKALVAYLLSLKREYPLPEATAK